MLRIIITSLLMVKRYILGNISTSRYFNNSKISLYFGLGTIKNHWIHLLIGLIFYISGVVIAQQQYIQHLWC